MNDQEFIADLLVRMGRLTQQQRRSIAERSFREIGQWTTDITRHGLSMVANQQYNSQLLINSAHNLQTALNRIQAMAADRPQHAYEIWLNRHATSANENIVRTEEYLTSQLAILRALVLGGTFTQLTLQPGEITLHTHPITIEYNGYTYNFGVYAVTIKPAAEVRINDVHDAVFISGGIPRDGHIHPHLATNGGGCLGSGLEPISRALINQSWSDAFLLIDQLLRVYNPESPAHDIESWGDHEECPECGDYVYEGAEGDADADTTVMINGQLYHERCTTVLSDNTAARFPLRGTVACNMCGRLNTHEQSRGADGCTGCRGFTLNERELARVGSAPCHNCGRVYASEHLDQLIILSRGDRVCTGCSARDTPASGYITIRESVRWNRESLIDLVMPTNSGRSTLRPNASTINRATPAIQRPVHMNCTCGVRQLSHEVSACKAIAAKTRCPACDPDNIGLSVEAQANPHTCLSIVTNWIDSQVHSRILDFFDFIHPATVSSDTLKHAVRSVLAAQAANAGIPAGRSVRAYINHVNQVLGYPAIIASAELIGVYDSTYHRAQTVA